MGSHRATLWLKAQHEGALPPPCIVRKDPRVPHTARRGPPRCVDSSPSCVVSCPRSVDSTPRCVDSSPRCVDSSSRQIDGETMETVSDFIFLGSKITADGGLQPWNQNTLAPWKKSYDQPAAAKSLQLCPTLCDPILRGLQVLIKQLTGADQLADRW